MKAEPSTLAVWAVLRPPTRASLGCHAVIAVQFNKEGTQQTPEIQVCWILAPCADAGWEQSLCLR